MKQPTITKCKADFHLKSRLILILLDYAAISILLWAHGCTFFSCNAIHRNEELYLNTLEVYIFSVANLTCLEDKDFKTRNKISKPYLQNR